MKYIIDFIDLATQDQIDAWLASNSISSSTKMATLTNVFVVESAAQPIATELVESIQEDRNISSQLLNTVENIPAQTTETATFDHDTEWWKTASIFNLDFNASSTTYQKRGSRTNVYVVDSGVKTDHPDLVNAGITNLFSFNGDFEDTNGHGTAIASVIVGDKLGITISKVKSVKIFDSTKTTMTSDLVAAFDAILADMLNNQTSAAIVNLSWSIPKNEYLESKIQALINAGAIVVAAAGNSGVPIENVTPASMDQVMTIGAYTEEFVPADFSNFTSTVKNTPNETNHGALDGWAPGTNINVAAIDNTVGKASGTSIATGIMTACLAYTSDIMYTESEVVPNYEADLKDWTLNKANLLTLSDKYEGSVNLIASFSDTAGEGLTSGSYSATRLVYSNAAVHGKLVVNSFVDKVELDGVLPEGLSLSNGWIVGQLVNPPSASEQHDYTVTATFKTGEVHSFKLNLILIAADIQEGDEPVDITLQACSINYAGSGNCGGTCSGGYCRSCDKYDCRCSNQYCP